MTETNYCIFCLEPVQEGEILIDAWFGHEPEGKFKIHRHCAELDLKKNPEKKIKRRKKE